MAETNRRPLWKDSATSSARIFGCTNGRCSFHGESLILIGCFALEKTMIQFRNERHGEYSKDPSIAVSLLLGDSSFYCWLVFHWILRCFHCDFLNFIGCFVSWTNSLLLRADILCLRLLHYANVVLLAWHLWMQLFIYWLLNYVSMWSYILYLSLARSPARGFSCLCSFLSVLWLGPLACSALGLDHLNLCQSSSPALIRAFRNFPYLSIYYFCHSNWVIVFQFLSLNDQSLYGDFVRILLLSLSWLLGVCLFLFNGLWLPLAASSVKFVPVGVAIHLFTRRRKAARHTTWAWRVKEWKRWSMLRSLDEQWKMCKVSLSL